jgi:NADPH:quinone reductase-like Zn-dependent oxidoreductase
MRALAQDRYGDCRVLSFRELPEPVVGSKDVLVAVRASALNPSDWNIRGGRARLLVPVRFPLVLGSDLSGVVLSVGAGVTRFRAGDEVFGACRPPRLGTLAERVAIEDDLLAQKPPILSFAEAASLPIAAQTAWQALFEVLAIERGERVLIVGGSGGVGTLAIQAAASHGAQVHATCGARNFEKIRALGAAPVAYDDSQRFAGTYDAILDAIGGAERRRAFAALRDGGRLVSITGIPTGAAVRRFGLGAPLRWLFDVLSQGERRAAARKHARYEYFFVEPSGARLASIADAVLRGALTPLVDATFPFERAIEALSRVESGHVTGKVVVVLP